MKCDAMMKEWMKKKCFGRKGDKKGASLVMKKEKKRKREVKGWECSNSLMDQSLCQVE